MTDQVKKAIIVLSFPRSGTHFTIDFIRKNLAGFNISLPFWQSSEQLYYDLDRTLPNGSRPWPLKALGYPRFIVKTHALPLEELLQNRLNEITSDTEYLFLTPYRNPSSMLASYARFTYFEGRLKDFLDSDDNYFKNGFSVRENFLNFFNFALEHSVFFDITKTISHPETYAAAIAKQIGVETLSVDNPLPKRRKHTGKLGEIASRLTGRETTEFVVPKTMRKPNWCDNDVPSDIANCILRAKNREVNVN